MLRDTRYIILQLPLLFEKCYCFCTCLYLYSHIIPVDRCLNLIWWKHVYDSCAIVKNSWPSLMSWCNLSFFDHITKSDLKSANDLHNFHRCRKTSTSGCVVSSRTSWVLNDLRTFRHRIRPELLLRSYYNTTHVR